MSLTIARALRRTIERLGPGGPPSDADELVSRLLGIGRGALHLQAERILSSEDLRRLDRWIERRAAGEPVQYITGRATFRGLDLAVTRGVLIPRPETEGLVEAVLETLRAAAERWPKPRVLDLGTGSGAIALAIATEHPAASVVATDASAEALGVARANASALASPVTFLAGDWFEPIPSDERFEVVVSNPPYIASHEWDLLPRDVREFEPASALFSGGSGLEAIREIVEEAPRHLVAGGLLALELAEMRAQEVAGWLEGAHDWQSVELRDDLSGRPRVLLARRAAGPAIAPAQWGEDR